MKTRTFTLEGGSVLVIPEDTPLMLVGNLTYQAGTLDAHLARHTRFRLSLEEADLFVRAERQRGHVAHALLEANAFVERELADDPSQGDAGCEIGHLRDVLDAALEALDLDTPEKREQARRT